jgi:rhodanese-related sulfurtransferase
MKWITAEECQKRMKSEDLKLVDIRENWEYDVCRIEAMHLPMDQVPETFAAMDKHASYVIVCKSGNRAQAVANLLESEYGFTNVLILEGGITAWMTHNDPSYEIY